MTDYLRLMADTADGSGTADAQTGPDHPPLASVHRDQILAQIEAILPGIWALARQIWQTPELGYQEFSTARAMCDLLEAEGFTVDRGVAGIPTAFVARSRGGPDTGPDTDPDTGPDDGPIIGLVAEMDALPGFSQDDAPYPNPVPGQANGHACGHHLFGAGSIGAGIALARWLRTTGTPGQVRIYGTPAEEGGAGKVFMARAGLFDDLALALHWHPDDRNAVWQSRSLASIGARYVFAGRSAHASLHPGRGRSALHGVEAFHHMASLMRQTVPDQTQIHYVITHGGDAPNIIPERAESYLVVRHPDAETAAAVRARIDAAARGAAMGTGTEVTIHPLAAVHPILPNATVGQVMLANMCALPPIRWTDAETAYARTIQDTLDRRPPLDAIARIIPYRYGSLGMFSSDMGDVSWLAPCGALGSVTWVPGTAPHTWQAASAGGTTIAMKGLRLAMQGLATTAAQFLSDPALLAQARADFLAARGADFVYRPLIADGHPPPMDYLAGIAGI